MFLQLRENFLRNQYTNKRYSLNFSLSKRKCVCLLDSSLYLYAPIRIGYVCLEEAEILIFMNGQVFMIHIIQFVVRNCTRAISSIIMLKYYLCIFLKEFQNQICDLMLALFRFSLTTINKPAKSEQRACLPTAPLRGRFTLPISFPFVCMNDISTRK